MKNLSKIEFPKSLYNFSYPSLTSPNLESFLKINHTVKYFIHDFAPIQQNNLEL